ncbi:MAG: MoaD/ThiS family protein [Desulfoplanes sp.]|jgi:sulfur carrier protein ThiS|nr:MoaD/ThiS family protein [Desulfoplanes sp.]MDD4650235.1 MoaD/ThiS family protein [Desulfoplanes sp.]
MRIDVKCFATLRGFTPDGGQMDVVPPLTLSGLLEKLGVPEKEVRLVFVNGKNESHWSREVQADDRIGIFPPVGGG